MNRLIALMPLAMFAGCGGSVSPKEGATSWAYNQTADPTLAADSVTAITVGRLIGDERPEISDPGPLRMTIERVAGQPDKGSLDAACLPGTDMSLRVDKSLPVTLSCVVSNSGLGPIPSGTPTFGADVVAQIAESENVYVELYGGPRSGQYIFDTSGLNLAGD